MVKKEKILITGGSGFIGSSLINSFIKKDETGEKYELYALSTSGNIPSIPSSHCFQVDIRDYEAVHKVINDINPDIIYNLSAVTRNSSDVDIVENMLQVNILGTINLLFSIVNTGLKIKKIIQVGSTEEYGENEIGKNHENTKLNPTSLYSASKASASLFCKVISDIYQVPITIVKPSLVYGPGQNNNFFIPEAIGKMIKHEEFKMTLGDQMRDFLYIDDCCEGLFLLKDHSSKYGVFNLSYGKSHSLKEVIEEIRIKTSSKSNIVFGAYPYRKNEVFNASYSNRKMNEELNWQPQVSFKEGIKKTISYYKGDEFD